ncbi:AAA family ATPase [Hydrogenophaga sp. RWCD_12]|uniref:AAA family ATPase n=1 Tax=Hydrogenophaga sp. RWCD_12 TaxID=3391190 RepID=UPI0039846D90
MYTAFFGLQRDPFTISPDPRYLFLSERHREAFAHLMYGAHGNGGFVLLTGDIGTGKTTVCRHFLEHTPAQSQVAYIFNPRLSVNELLRSIADEFGYAVPAHSNRETTVKELVDPLNRFLLTAHAAGRNPILIIDEAQNLSPEVLEQLRLLTNLETHERKLLQIVLIGQPELRGILSRPGLEQLAQRIVARFHLGPLDEADTRRYIKHRLVVAGLEGPVPFTARALRRIHSLSGGVPRKINLLCGRALLGAYATGARSAGPQVIERAAVEVFGPAGTTALRARSLALLMAGGLAGAVIAGALLWGWRASSTTATVAPANSVPPAAASGAAPAAAPQPAPAPPKPAAVAPMPAANELLTSEEAGWRTLAPRWGMKPVEGALCPAALTQGLQCYFTTRMTLHGIGQMDRPALLRLRLQAGGGYAVVEGLDNGRLTLSAGDRRWTVDDSWLQRTWQGEYLTLWRTPQGQKGHLSNGLVSPPAVRWMTQTLNSLQQQGQIDPKAVSLPQKVAAFQRSRGVEVDGRATPTTLILLNRASGENEPRLSVTNP